jgi:DNA-binding MarR family transcriptional regulator
MSKRPAAAENVPFPGSIDHSKFKNLLGYHLAQASVPTNQIFKKNVANVFKLSKVEFTILMLLSSNQGMAPKKLSSILNIPPPNLTILLSKLERRGLISREQASQDKRAQVVSLSTAGVELVGELSVVIETMEEEILKALTQAERAMLLELLRKVSLQRVVD